jgi:hypothetical protein
LVENQGWAYFIYTPRGHSHGYDLYKRALASDHWFCEVLTINDTKVVTKADVTLAVAGGMSEDMVEQEFYCSFEASMPGAIYGKQIQAATKEGRITGVPHQEGFDVHTYWDLGYRDSTAIWFVQDAGREIHLIDYYENALQPLSHYLDVLKNYHNDKGYMYGNHYAPHDIKVHTIGSFGMSTWEQAKEKGLTFQVMPKLKREAGIEASRALFSSCWFDAIKCEHGIDALKTYRYEYKIDTKAYHLEPVHDWASDGADAFRTLGVCHQFEEKKEEMKDIDYGDPDGYAGYYKGGL